MISIKKYDKMEKVLNDLKIIIKKYQILDSWWNDVNFYLPYSINEKEKEIIKKIYIISNIIEINNSFTFIYDPNEWLFVNSNTNKKNLCIDQYI